MLFKSIFSVGITTAVLLSAVGCSAISEMFVKPAPSFLTIDKANKQIEEARVCCENNIFNGQIINVTKTSEESYKFDLENAQAFNFPTGKSFFKIFQLPVNVSYLSINFESEIINTTFQPKVDFYNARKQIVSTIKPNAFKYRDSAFTDGVLASKIVINNASAKPGRELAYMVIYTTDSNRAETTSMMHPEVKRAIAQNVVPPHFDDIKVPHAPIGTVTISFKFRQEESSAVEDLMSYLDGPLIGDGAAGENNRHEDVVLASGEVYSVSSQREGTTAVISTDSKGNSLVNSNDVAGTNLENVGRTAQAAQSSNQPQVSMMKETEEMYNGLIKKAVQAGDYEKAMSLVGEAQRAGSDTAQQTFIEAVKAKK